MTVGSLRLVVDVSTREARPADEQPAFKRAGPTGGRYFRSRRTRRRAVSQGFSSEESPRD